MTSAIVTPGRREARRRAAASPSRSRWMAVGLVAAIALLGALLARQELVGHNDPGVAEIGASIKTSFGVVAVEHVERLEGLGAKSLSGANHGIQNLVAPDQLQLQVSVTITNQSREVVGYDPTQFSLRVGQNAKLVAAQATTLGSGTLQPNTNIDGRLGFVAPRDGSQLLLEFRDPGRPDPVLIDLGTTDKAPTLGSDGHYHGGSK